MEKEYKKIWDKYVDDMKSPIGTWKRIVKDSDTEAFRDFMEKINEHFDCDILSYEMKCFCYPNEEDIYDGKMLMIVNITEAD